MSEAQNGTFGKKNYCPAPWATKVLFNCNCWHQNTLCSVPRLLPRSVDCAGNSCTPCTRTCPRIQVCASEASSPSLRAAQPGLIQKRTFHQDTENWCKGLTYQNQNFSPEGAKPQIWSKRQQKKRPAKQCILLIPFFRPRVGIGRVGRKQDFGPLHPPLLNQQLKEPISSQLWFLIFRSRNTCMARRFRRALRCTASMSPTAKPIWKQQQQEL